MQNVVYFLVGTIIILSSRQRFRPWRTTISVIYAVYETCTANMTWQYDKLFKEKVKASLSKIKCHITNINVLFMVIIELMVFMCMHKKTFNKFFHLPLWNQWRSLIMIRRYIISHNYMQLCNNVQIIVAWYVGSRNQAKLQEYLVENLSFPLSIKLLICLCTKIAAFADRSHLDKVKDKHDNIYWWSITVCSNTTC